MDNAAYIVLSRQLGLFRQMDVVANNIANVNTDGFKGELMTYRDFPLGKGLPVDANPNRMDFVQDVATRRDTSEGSVRMTNRPYDMAIHGNAFFEVETPLGARYTRAGAFQRDNAGQLVTSEGYILQGTDGPITLLEEDKDVRIYADGRVTAQGIDGLEEDRGTVRMVGFENDQMLRKTGNGLYEALPEAVESNLQPGVNVRLSQGMLEGSNVNPMLETTRMITVNRGVGTTSNFLKQVADLQSRAVEVISQQQ